MQKKMSISVILAAYRGEDYIVEQLRREDDKIKIIVAHRLNTLVHCNKIIAIINTATIINKTNNTENIFIPLFFLLHLKP